VSNEKVWREGDDFIVEIDNKTTKVALKAVLWHAANKKNQIEDTAAALNVLHGCILGRTDSVNGLDEYSARGLAVLLDLVAGDLSTNLDSPLSKAAEAVFESAMLSDDVVR